MRRLWLALVAVALIFLPFSYTPQAIAQSSSAKICNKVAIYDNSNGGSTQMIAAGNGIYVCGFVLFSAGTTNVKLVSGAGTNCATSPTDLTPAFEFTAQTGLSDPSPYFRGMFVANGRALCINSSGSIAVQAMVYFAQ